MNFKTYFPTTTVVVHWMPWFGTLGHAALNYTLQSGVTLPYLSSNSSICDDQCAVMKAAGVDAINVDYYGPDSASALACLRMLSACEHAGLGYSLCIDVGALGSLTGAAATAEYTRILNFAAEAMFTSPSYLRDSSFRAMVSFFEEPSSVDWKAVRAGVTRDKMAWLFEGSFNHTESDGAFAWVNPIPGQPANINKTALQAFVAGAAAAPTKLAWFAAFAGFDDALATWGTGRVISRRMGRTWAETAALVPATAKYVIIPTWNDYEEGSNQETAGSLA